MMTRFPASRSFPIVPLRGSSTSSGGIRDKPGTLQAGQGMLHEGGGCPVNRGRERGRERGRWAPSRARGWRLAAPHLLTGPSSATCSEALVRPVKSGRRVICRSHRNAVWASQTRWCRGAMLRAQGGKLLDDAINAERCGWAKVLEGGGRSRTGPVGQSSWAIAKLARI